MNCMGSKMDELEDDTHFCLKCHSTIIGLDVYVNHRKNNCTKKGDAAFSALKADDFFSSLELQSSSKKILQQSTSGKHSTGILTRSKISAFKELSEPSKSGKNVWIGGAQAKEVESDDNLGNMMKTLPSKDGEMVKDITRTPEYVDSDVESEEYYLDEETSDEDAPPRNHTGGKWKPSSPIYWKHSQTETEWKPPPPSFTGGKWKPTIIKRSFSPPPPNHTRGKWKPGQEGLQITSLSGKVVKKAENASIPDLPCDDISKSKPNNPVDKNEFHLSLEPPHDKWRVVEMIPSTYTKGKWKPGSSPEPIPSNYTGGKWKPGTSPEPSTSITMRSKSYSLISNKDTVAQPKYTDVSPLIKSSGSVQYWCKPCNRRLASKIVYERHLKSEYHTKRTMRENDLEEHFNYFKSSRSTRKKTMLHSDGQKIHDLSNKRIRQKTFEICNVCHSIVNVSLMGKHLISHYHCRKSDLTTDSAQKMILDNFESIVKQSPFQCKPCKYYFSCHSDFLRHWVSEDHRTVSSSKMGEFLCSYCEVSCLENEEMYQHLTSQDHSEVISVINRSVPIIIKKVQYKKCDTCGDKFLFFIQLKKHIEKTGHQLFENDNNEYKCDVCDQNLNSRIALQRHKRFVHKIKSFICGTCDLIFSTDEEVQKHRNSEHHHHTTIDKKNNESGKSLERKCQYCSSIFENFTKLKEHIKNEHKEFHSRCPKCGMSFVVPQDLSVHLRNKACKVEEHETKKFTCNQCSFAVDTEADILFHKSLHTEPIHMYPDSACTSDKKTIPHYKCSKCHKLFPKSSLLGHLRLHTQERPYKCSFCAKTFVRKNNLLFHEKKHSSGKTEKKAQSPSDDNRPYLCSTCGASFKKRFILQQHMKIHTGKSFKCNRNDCIFTGRSLAELKLHFLTHYDEKKIACKSCDYKGKTKQQLMRHMTVHEDTKKFKCSSCSFTARTSHHLVRHTRLHTGSKPYQCPHCTYSCNSLENMRKHILSTNKHPGKSIYECKFCEGERFQTNFFKEFKAHLLTLHPDEMDKGYNIKSSSVYEAKKDQFHPIGNSNADPRTGTTIEDTGPNEKTNNRIIKESQSLSGSVNSVPLVVSKEDSMDPGASENWNLVGCYDVSESGTLVPFNKDVLFEDVM